MNITAVVLPGSSYEVLTNETGRKTDQIHKTLVLSVLVYLDAIGND